MARIAKIKYNDASNTPGICVSLWMQGCPFRCKGCHNPETWDFNGGAYIDDTKLSEIIIESISTNKVMRNFAILGGEPLCNNNVDSVSFIISKVREKYPDIKIYLWTGYLLEDLQERAKTESSIKSILDNINCLIDGQFEIDKRDLTLELRGSSNQRIFTFR